MCGAVFDNRKPKGCGLNLNMSDAEKALVRSHFSKSPIRTLAPNSGYPLWGDRNYFVLKMGLESSSCAERRDKTD